MKKGQRVRIISDTCAGFYTNRIGMVLEEDAAPYVSIDNVEKHCFSETELEPVEPSIDTLIVGDVIVTQEGDEAKVLAVQGDVFLKSSWDNFDEAGYWYAKSQAKENGWKLKDQNIEEMTVKEICKELGRDIKIK